MKDDDSAKDQGVLLEGKFARASRWVGIFLALLVLGAHFFRASEYGLVLCVFGMVFFFCTKVVWRQYAVGLFLIWGALEWADSAYFLANMRMQAGLPWLRASLILSVVALLTLLAGVQAFKRAKLLSKFAGDDLALFQAGIFIFTMLGLLFLSKQVPLDLFLLERYFPVFGKAQIFISAWYAAFMAKGLLASRTSRNFRKKIWLIFSLVFFSQLALGLLGMQEMLMTGRLHVPIPAFIVLAPIFRGSLTMMPILVLVSVILLGSAWCSFLCYFGAFDAFAAGKKAVKTLPVKGYWFLKYGRMLVLVLGIVVALGLRMGGASTYFAVTLALLFGFFGLLVMLIFSRKYASMIHCTTFCPMGLLVNVLGKFSFWKIKIDKTLCDNCGACEKVCLYHAIDEQSRNDGRTLLRCSLCRDCIGVCKKGAISLGCFAFAPALSQRIFVALVVVLHVLFITVARV